MGLAALEIYKHLPKKNCMECGVQTCLAFAMALSQGKTQIEKCPYLTESAREYLGSASAPPMKLVKIGKGVHEVLLGEETVMFRHEKTFYHQGAIALLIKDTMSKDEIDRIISNAKLARIERVGVLMKVDMFGVMCSSGDVEKYAECVRYVQDKGVIDGVPLPMVLMSEKPEVIDGGLKITNEYRPLIHGATFDNYKEMAGLAKKYKCPLVVRGEDIEKLSELSEKVKREGVDEIILDIEYDSAIGNIGNRKSLGDAISDLTKIRRLALKKKHKALGYPTMVIMQDGKCYEEESLEASSFLMKYSGIVVLRHAELDAIFPILVMRQNIFTDPQKPIQVKPGIYEIGRPNEDAPVLITTNFSLTYFCVASDIDNAKIPSYLLVIDTDGLSVLTAYAAGKWTAEQTAEFLQKCGIENRVKHRSIIIPGLVARMSGKLAEKSSWNVLVGPKESAALGAYIKNEWAKKKK